MRKVILYGTAGAHALGGLALAGVSGLPFLKPMVVILLLVVAFLVLMVGVVAVGLWVAMRAMYPEEHPIRPPRRMPRTGPLSSMRDPSSRDLPQ